MTASKLPLPKLRLFPFVAGALLAGGFAQAQQPASNSSTPAAAAPAPAATQPARNPATDAKASEARPTRTAQAGKPPDSTARLIRDARSAGFKPERVKGTLMFCRMAKELGSNFPVRTCYDEQQTKIKIHQYQTQRNQLEQMHSSGLWGN